MIKTISKEEMLKTKIQLLKDMHKYIINEIDDENAYYEWIEIGVPDEPTEEDFEYIAENDWISTVEFFGHIVMNYK